MLLDLGLPSALIGGIVLPLLGAVPDAAMIIASGVGKSREQANKEIAVGMGYLYMYLQVLIRMHILVYRKLFTFFNFMKSTNELKLKTQVNKKFFKLKNME